MAQWLDTVFFTFDHAILQGIHRFAAAMGGSDGFFTWLMRFVSLLGEGGIGFLVLGGVLFCFKKTRKAGLCVLFGLFCGMMITNIAVKNLVARTRPFQNTEVTVFREWWVYIGGPVAGEKSFPSGHTTSAMATMTAIFLNFPKKYSWTAYIFVALTGLSRMYLMVHYPTDILGGLLAGGLAAAGGYFITMGVLKVMHAHTDCAFCRGVVGFDLAVPLGRLCHKKSNRFKKNETNDACGDINADTNASHTEKR